MCGGATRPRARGLGVPFNGTPGPLNAITDVAGVHVGHETILADGAEGVAVRTGVTAVLPRGRRYDPVFAGWFSLNGNGEMTGTTWLAESGFLEGPVLLTNTHSVGVVRDAAVEWMIRHGLYDPNAFGHYWMLPVVAETYDGFLNDINGFHVRPEHVFAALDGATAGGPVQEGNVGGGTGMKCYWFKGGIGTASRVLPAEAGGWTVGALVQANFGRREDLVIAGVPVGRHITELMPEGGWWSGGAGGSVIVVVATDAPLLPHQLTRLARRVPMGLARTGSFAANTSGDIFIAFSTANPDAAARSRMRTLQMLPNDLMDGLFKATVQATEEAVVNALVAAETMVGHLGRRVHALPHERLRELMANSPKG